MRNIYAIGESLLDIIFSDGQPQAAKAGGSMLNSAVSLGRVGLPVSFISEYGADDIGVLIDTFLKDNGVNTGFVHRFKNGNTALALAFLDERNDAHYSFYKDYPPERFEISFPEFCDEDILLCGSFYAIATEFRQKFLSLITGARVKGAMIIYDPNFRKSHLNEIENLRPLIIENMKNASLVRGSDEDFRNIFGSEDADAAWDEVRNYCSCLVYTANADGVYVRTPSISSRFDVRKISPVSTIGAGDNFNAGMITSFCSEKFRNEDLCTMGKDEWMKVISTAVEFATNVCLSYDNYIDGAFASRYRSASRFQI
jgi:fructokinase